MFAGSAGPSGGGPNTPGGLSNSAYHQLALIQEQLTQQQSETQVAIAQVRLLKDQLVAESSARIEAQSRVHQLLIQNRDLLVYIQQLVAQLNNIQEGGGSGGKFTTVGLGSIPAGVHSTATATAQLPLSLPHSLLASLGLNSASGPNQQQSGSGSNAASPNNTLSNNQQQLNVAPVKVDKITPQFTTASAASNSNNSVSQTATAASTADFNPSSNSTNTSSTNSAPPTNIQSPSVESSSKLEAQTSVDSKNDSTSEKTENAQKSNMEQSHSSNVVNLNNPNFEDQVTKLEEISKLISKQLALAEKVAARNKAALEATGMIDMDSGSSNGSGNGDSQGKGSGNNVTAAALAAAAKRQSIHRASIACSPIPEAEMLNAATSFEELGAYNAIYNAVAAHVDSATNAAVLENQQAEQSEGVELNKLSASQRSLPALLPSHLSFMPPVPPTVGYPPISFLPNVIQNPASPGFAISNNKSPTNFQSATVPRNATTQLGYDNTNNGPGGDRTPVIGVEVSSQHHHSTSSNMNPQQSMLARSENIDESSNNMPPPPAPVAYNRANGNLTLEVTSGGSSFDSDCYGSTGGGSKSGDRINYLETTLGPKVMTTSVPGGPNHDDDINGVNSDGDSGYDKQSSLNNNGNNLFYNTEC